jgi:hypothetical protein
MVQLSGKCAALVFAEEEETAKDLRLDVQLQEACAHAIDTEGVCGDVDPEQEGSATQCLVRRTDSGSGRQLTAVDDGWLAAMGGGWLDAPAATLSAASCWLSCCGAPQRVIAHDSHAAAATLIQACADPTSRLQAVVMRTSLFTPTCLLLQIEHRAQVGALCQEQLERWEVQRADDVRLDRHLFWACSAEMRSGGCKGVKHGAPLTWHLLCYCPCAACNAGARVVGAMPAMHTSCALLRAPLRLQPP